MTYVVAVEAATECECGVHKANLVANSNESRQNIAVGSVANKRVQLGAVTND
jgi:hypothetical protein